MTEPVIQGTFIGLNDRTGAFDRGDWRRCFDEMEKVGLRFVIPTPCSQIIDKPGAFYASVELPLAANTDVLSIIMEEVKHRGMEIYLSTPMIPYGPRSDIATWMEQAKEETYRLNLELWKAYEGHPSWKGWYISHEIHELWFLEPQSRQQAMIDYHRHITDQVRKLSPEMKILIAPFFTLEFSPPRSPDELRLAWTAFLQAVDIDILMLQDGRGSNRGIEEPDVQVIFEAVRRACDETSIAFWADVETFNLIPNSNGTPGYLQPTDFARLRGQLETVAKYTERIGIWEFISTMLYPPSARDTVAASQLLKEYGAYAKRRHM